MSFYIALSGVRAASADLGIIGNNIANAATTGFKQSRSEFGDIYAARLGAPGLAVGQGVSLTRVAQQFTQGNVAFTGNSLDMAINGRGFFTLADADGAAAFSRAGHFKLDRDGYVVNNEGLFLQARQADSGGNITGGVANLQLDKSYMDPAASSSVTGNINFDSRESETDSSWAFSAGVADPNGYNSSTSTTVYDSLGNPHTMTMYFSKLDPTANPNEWNVRTVIDDVEQDTTAVTFNTDGSYNTPADIPITWTPGGGATPAQTVTIDLSDSTQFGSSFAVNSLSQNGNTSGQVLGVDIDEEGIVFARYSNGVSRAMGQVVLADFTNPQGLQPMGNTAWVETHSSGEPTISDPGTAGRGLIQSAALEESNVDLTEQLVKMISAQRNFQANAQTIQAEDAITQTIINLR